MEGTRSATRKSATWGSNKKIGALVAAIVATAALAAPGVASASSYWSPLPPPQSPTIVGTSSGGVVSDVSWSDVSWSDSLLY